MLSGQGSGVRAWGFQYILQVGFMRNIGFRSWGRRVWEHFLLGPGFIAISFSSVPASARL